MSEPSENLQALTAGMLRSEEFPRAAAESVRCLHEAVSDKAQVSVYLVDPDRQRATHYYLYPTPTGFESVPVHVDSTLFRPLTTGRLEIWRDGDLANIVLPGACGVVSLTCERGLDFSEDDASRLAALVPAVELLCLRHRDLHRAEALAVRVTQADESLTALYEGSYDLSGVTQAQVARKVIDLIRDRFGLDRAGLFLRDGDVVRGAWGVDDKGEIVPIEGTVFELHPERDEDLSEAALIVRGELEYFLTQDLDGEGHESIEGDIGASVSVPMRVGDRIIGLLSADTYLTREPIDPALLRPLMILANQAATAIENAKLYADLHEASVHLERRVAERTAELSQANADKELLLKEVYHRTKNNLQLVVSMLNLQARRIDDERALEALEDCASRVYTMSTIHEQLYQESELKAIDFGKHLHTLVSQLLDSYEVSPGSIRIRIDADTLLLSLDTAIPLSLIVNEVVTNCLKYAFPNGRSGIIDIGLHIRGEDVSLEIVDDGVGLPDGFDVESVSTMGLQIVKSLAKQLQARMTLDSERGKGAGFHILLPGLAAG